MYPYLPSKKNQAKLSVYNHKNHEWKTVLHVAKMLTANSDCTIKKEVGEVGGRGEERDHNLSSNNEEHSFFLAGSPNYKYFLLTKNTNKNCRKIPTEERVQQNNY